jgi:choline dehydrogenase-like flavoprotein
MAHFDFDFFVIGGGSGGVRAARMAAQKGVRVALAEALGTDGLGGTCVNVGCIPKKLYSYAAHYAEAFEESHGYGWEGPAPTLNWATLKTRRAQEIARLNGVYAHLLRGSGVTLLNGFAQLQDGHTVRLATLNADGSPGPPDLHRRTHPDRHRWHAARAPLPGARARHHLQRGVRPGALSRSGCWWWAAATSPASSPPSSTAWAHR